MVTLQAYVQAMIAGGILEQAEMDGALIKWINAGVIQH